MICHSKQFKVPVILFSDRVEKLQEYHLEFTGDDYVGINVRTGSVILGDVKEPVLYKFIVSQEDGYYRKAWKCECPVISDKAVGSKIRCRRYLSVLDDVILQPCISEITGMFHHDSMKLIHKWQLTGIFDEIITCLPGPRAVFAIRDQDALRWHIEIKYQTCTLTSLRPSGHQWQNPVLSYLSACEDTNNGTIAVTGARFTEVRGSRGSLDIFTCDGM